MVIAEQSLLSMMIILKYLRSSFLKDTTDYVAYVAKDPVNQRGMETISRLSCMFLQLLYLY